MIRLLATVQQNFTLNLSMQVFGDSHKPSDQKPFWHYSKAQNFISLSSQEL